jgi:hypothetical protein
MITNVARQPFKDCQGQSEQNSKSRKASIEQLTGIISQDKVSGKEYSGQDDKNRIAKMREETRVLGQESKDRTAEIGQTDRKVGIVPYTGIA